MARIIDPVLNIFIGTSPTIVSRTVNRQLARLDASDRQRIATLMIDTMRIQRSADGASYVGSDILQIQTPRFEFSAAWTDEQVRNLLVTADRGRFVHRPGIGSAGAGGIRNNAHVAMALSAANLRQRINQKLDMICAPSETRQDQQLSSTVRINIITFLGGGTGSGVMPALTLLTRYLTQQHNANRPQTAIYAVLPEQPLGLTEEMIRRQRSNTFATLIELITLLHLTRGKRDQDSFIFPLGSLQLDVSQLQVVDVIYLYGQGRLTSHSEIYEHIAMDLLLRMQDGHGAGFERQRQLPDLSALNDTDSKGIPARFATSGAVEIVLPREELLAAFARRASREILEDQNRPLPSFAAEDALAGKIEVDVAAQLDAAERNLTNDHLSNCSLKPNDDPADADKLFTDRLNTIEPTIAEATIVARERARKLVHDAIGAHIRAVPESEVAIERYLLEQLRRRINQRKPREPDDIKPIPKPPAPTGLAALWDLLIGFANPRAKRNDRARWR